MKILLTSIAFIFSVYYVFFADGINVSNYNSSDDVEVEVYLSGLNSYDDSTLVEIKDLIESFGYNCEITDPTQTAYQNDIMVCSEIQEELGGNLSFEYDDSEPITIYFTNSKLIDGNLRVSGLCYGNTILARNNKHIKETIIHELLHSFGLGHCENVCIMNSNKFNGWDSASNKPIFCDDCRSKAPSQF
jgi:hypothetical protein